MALLNKSKKVAVALSGGVDSSVACALLKQQGYEVVGFHMRLWKAKGRSALPQNVKQIGKVLGIKTFVFDFQKEFKDCVVDYFVDSYRKGITPNPCVVCNAKIKFGLLMEKARELGCDFLATGHYARTENGRLLKAKFEQKDQTYFLWQLKQSQLKRVIFPLGGIVSKQKVREMAKEFGLPTFATPESNDVCFLQDINIQDFLKKNCPGVRPRGAGEIVDTKGQVLGEHQGLWFYTIGQRKGINIPAEKGRSALPYFVVAKDIKKNVLIISQDENDLLSRELIAQKVNWLSGGEPANFHNFQAKIRYGAKPAKIKAMQKISLNKYKIIFAQPQRAITPGQSVVWYQGDELLGGGVIS
ncbi:MAG: tRNA 2-thiouridine(34) synthase MnmA [Candidatus Gribaldobacteria bacterium]|nr:tRNA 2-thiouridine(34) synthase MnmA [Candidatus Gribaldobacteria bacterium]